MIKKIALMGTGALGTILGAHITKAGYDITLVDAYEAHVDAMKTKGATIVGSKEFTIPVKACTPANMDGTYDLFIYLAKQTANDIAIPQMLSHAHKDTIFCVAQNGIPELAVAKHWPKSQICGAPVGWGAVMQGPGVSKLTSELNAMSFHLGTMEGPTTPWLFEVQNILESLCPTVVTENLMGDRWAKLLINAAFSGLSANINDTFGAVLNDDIGIQCLARLGNEVVRCCEADGVKLETFAGMDLAKMFTFCNKAEQKVAEENIRASFKIHGALQSSMIGDLAAGKPCEVMAMDGVVAETGDKHGIDTPITDMVIKNILEIEAGKRTMGKKNLQNFIPLL